jgi:NAD(P)-dependent dehydrogenase (short-subunit alcohol dehydrogenase family)
MKKVFITGANKSIGFETAKQLLRKGYYVFLGSRNLAKGKEAVKSLHTQGLINVETIEIDVTNADSIGAARTAIGKKTDRLDVLINNAGISGGVPQNVLGTAVQVFRDVYETNVFGVVSVTQAFIDLLKKSDEPRIR